MNRIQKFIIVFFSALIIASYVLGFYYNENSIGSGGYSGDFAWMWENFEIFKNENLLQAVKSNDFFGNRIDFKTFLVPYKSDPSWIPNKIIDMKKTLDSKDVPEYNVNCESCTYLYCSKKIV